MGNSTGNLSDYWEVINKHEILAGGFIWDWVDQGLLEHDADGNPYWTYGGDYGPADVPSSGNFNFNGIVFPDRRVQPAYWEVKRVYQYVDFSARNLEAGVIAIANQYDFTDLSDFELQWEVTADGRVVQNGTVRELDIGPESEGEVRLQYNLRTLQTGPEHHLNLRLVSLQERGILPAEHVYAEAQFALTENPRRLIVERPGPGEITTDRTDTELRISTGLLEVEIGAETGLLESIRLADQEMLLAPLTPNFWRAPTDNDFGNYMQDWAASWEQAGRNRKLESVDFVLRENYRSAVKAVYSFTDDQGITLGEWQTFFSVLPDGLIIVDNTFTKEDGLPVMPRVGMNVELPRRMDDIEWFGRGPFENYADRNIAANVGRYANKVADHYVPYMRPQENGYKTDVRWLSLSDGADTGLLVIADDLISFGVHHNRLSDFVPPAKIAITSEDGPGARNNTERVNVHVSDVSPRDLVSLDLDYGQMGVGGDDSWGKRTLQKYSLNEKTYHYRFVLRPYEVSSGALDRLVAR